MINLIERRSLIPYLFKQKQRKIDDLCNRILTYGKVNYNINTALQITKKNNHELSKSYKILNRENNLYHKIPFKYIEELILNYYGDINFLDKFQCPIGLLNIILSKKINPIVWQTTGKFECNLQKVNVSTNEQRNLITCAPEDKNPFSYMTEELLYNINDSDIVYDFYKRYDVTDMDIMPDNTRTSYALPKIKKVVTNNFITIILTVTGYVFMVGNTNNLININNGSYNTIDDDFFYNIPIKSETSNLYPLHDYMGLYTHETLQNQSNIIEDIYITEKSNIFLITKSKDIIVGGVNKNRELGVSNPANNLSYTYRFLKIDDL